MAQMPIEVLDLRRKKTDLFSVSIALANKAQDQFCFSLLDDSKAYELLFAIHDDTNMDAFLKKFWERKLSWRGFHPFLLCVFDTAINSDGIHNLFSVDVADAGFAAVTIHNVEGVLIPLEKMVAYAVFYLALFSLKFSGCNQSFHAENRDCLFDYREDKTRIVAAIRKGAICDSCKNELEKQEQGASAGQLKAIFSLFDLASRIMHHGLPINPNRKPRVFIGSSVEGIDVARAIQQELEHDSEVEIWNQSDVFVLGSATLEALEAAVENYDLGVFVFTPDDEITSREVTKPVARDNVIFEAGLFAGKLGRLRSVIVRPRNISMQVPSDLNGIALADYDSSKKNLSAAVGTACTKIRATMKRLP